MGIINLHPQSFSATGRLNTSETAIVYAKQLIAEGAVFIDLGAEPTNPWISTSVQASDEIAMLVPVIQELTRTTKAIISVDTSNPLVMQAVIAAGAHMINDVRALTSPGALAIVADSDVGICLMHHRPISKDEPLILQINRDLQAHVDRCLQAGIVLERICIDPGFGGGSEVFHKSEVQNRELLAQLSGLTVAPRRPLLVGLSRKGFIGQWMNPHTPVIEAERLPGSLAAVLWAIQAGAHIIRTHDVKATVDAVNVWSLLNN